MVWFSASEEGRVGSDTPGNPGTVTNDMLLRHKVLRPLLAAFDSLSPLVHMFPSSHCFFHECQPGFANGGVAVKAETPSCHAVFLRYRGAGHPRIACLKVCAVGTLTPLEGLLLVFCAGRVTLASVDTWCCSERYSGVTAVVPPQDQVWVLA